MLVQYSALLILAPAFVALALPGPRAAVALAVAVARAAARAFAVLRRAAAAAGTAHSTNNCVLLKSIIYLLLLCTLAKLVPYVLLGP